MIWHACGKCFVTCFEKWRLYKHCFLPKKKKILQTTFMFDLKMLLPIILLRLNDWLGKKDHRFEGSVGKMAVILSLLKKDETSSDVAALVTILADESGLQ